MSVHNEELPAYILKLNDDCLMNIMDLLPKSDFLSFVLTCRRILGAHQQRCQKLFECMKSSELESLALSNWMPFFKFCGQYVKDITIYESSKCNDQELFELIGAYCINLKSIHISWIEITQSDMRNIFSKLNQLQNVKLIDCGLQDDCLLELRHLSQLKKLDISRNFNLTFLNVDQLPGSIESLSLECDGMQLELLTEFCKARPQLKELGVFVLGSLTNLFQQLVSGNCCDSLESLWYGLRDEDEQDAEYEAIAMLPSLKKLTLQTFSEELRPEIIAMLVKHKSRQLEYLELDGSSSIYYDALFEISKLSALRVLVFKHRTYFTDPEIEVLCNLQQLEEIQLVRSTEISNDAVLRLIFACPKLQFLYLEDCKITEKLLQDLKRELRPHIGQRPLPIKLRLSYFRSTQIKSNMLKKLDVASKQIIDVTVD